MVNTPRPRLIFVVETTQGKSDVSELDDKAAVISSEDTRTLLLFHVGGVRLVCDRLCLGVIDVKAVMRRRIG